MKNSSEKREQKPKRYQRLQGDEWNLVKDNFKLLYTYTSDNGNIKGIYTNGKDRIAHWMNDAEKKEYLATKEEK